MGSRSKFVFVTGMFRSGTTLLGRMLHGHPQIALASDPCLPLFKALRSGLATELGLAVDWAAPLADYYFDHDGLALYRQVQAASLDRAVDKERLGELQAAIRRYGAPYSPRVTSRVEELVGDSYSEILGRLLELVADAYGDSSTRLVGVKEVWADEFIPAIARSFPQAQFIQIVRDPRAVSASKNVTTERYPWLFLGRQWRKLSTLAWSYQNAAWLSSRTLLIYFEDLVARPSLVAKRICEFAGLDFDERMTQAAEYRDGGDSPWQQNTAYAVAPSSSFDAAAISRWRTVLSSREQAHIEFLCKPEMAIHGYSSDWSEEELPGGLCSPPTIDAGQLAPWVVDLELSDKLSVTLESAHEVLRYSVLSANRTEYEGLAPDLVAACYLEPALVQVMRRERQGVDLH